MIIFVVLGIYSDGCGNVWTIFLVCIGILIMDLADNMYTFHNMLSVLQTNMWLI